MGKAKVKIKNPEDNFDFMKTNKDNIQNTLRDTDTILPIINDIVNRTNKIVIHSYQFIKLYFSFLYKKKSIFPKIDKQFISDVFKVVTIRTFTQDRNKNVKISEQLKTLTNFYEEHYIDTLHNNEIILSDKLSYILAYEAIDMVTNINNNIHEHFIDHLNKYVNYTFKLKEQSTEITKNNPNKIIRKELHKNLYHEFNKIKKDLITFGEDFTSDPKYHSWIKRQKLKLFPNKTEFKKNSIHYDLKSNPQDYLISMFYLLDKLEKINKNNIDNKQIRLFNVLPLRSNIIGKNITIDTCALIYNFCETKGNEKLKKEYTKDDNQYCFY